MSNLSYEARTQADAFACEFYEEFENIDVHYNIEAGEDGGREYPSTPDHVSDIYVSVRGSSWMVLDDLDADFETELMDLAADSYDGEP